MVLQKQIFHRFSKNVYANKISQDIFIPSDESLSNFLISLLEQYDTT